MSENRFQTAEENMADYMAQKLPRKDECEVFGDFYQRTWEWCLNHRELMELFVRIPHDQEAFRTCLEMATDERNCERFGLALALRMDELRKI